MLSRKQLGCQNVLTIVPCTSAIRALPVFSVGHHPAHNFLVKCTCCHFAQVIGVTLDPKNTFPYLLKNRASTRVRKASHFPTSATCPPPWQGCRISRRACCQPQ